MPFSSQLLLYLISFHFIHWLTLLYLTLLYADYMQLSDLGCGSRFVHYTALCRSCIRSQRQEWISARLSRESECTKPHPTPTPTSHDHCAVPVCASEHERYWHPTQPNPTPPHPNLSINLFVYLSVCLSIYLNLSKSI